MSINYKELYYEQLYITIKASKAYFRDPHYDAESTLENALLELNIMASKAGRNKLSNRIQSNFFYDKEIVSLYLSFK